MFLWGGQSPNTWRAEMRNSMVIRMILAVLSLCSSSCDREKTKYKAPSRQAQMDLPHEGVGQADDEPDRAANQRKIGAPEGARDCQLVDGALRDGTHSAASTHRDTARAGGRGLNEQEGGDGTHRCVNPRPPSSLFWNFYTRRSRSRVCVNLICETNSGMCDTRMIAPSKSSMAFAITGRWRKLMWLVGSSRMRRPGSWSTNRA